jgi:erythromycin esterase
MLTLGARAAAAAHSDQAEDFLTWARASSAPLTVDNVLKAAGRAKVVALAEFMHGAHEPLQLRNDLALAMAKDGFLGAVALETGFIEARRLDDYVMGGGGDAAVLARDYLSWGFGAFEENVELLRSLRDHNAGAGVRKVRFFGVDIPGGKGRALGSISLGVRDAIAYVSTTLPRQGRSLVRALQPYVNEFTPEAYFALSGQKRTVFVAAIDDLVRFFSENRAALISKSSVVEFTWAQRSAVVLRQGAEMFRVWPEDNQKGDSPRGMYGTVSVRDAALAANLEWVVRQQDPSASVLVFAATGHLVRTVNRGPVLSGFPGPWKPMGFHLEQAFGRDMTVIFTSAPEAPPGPWQGKPAAGSFAADLSNVGAGPFLLDLRTAPPMAALDTCRTFGNPLMLGMAARPREAFDVVVFFSKVTAATEATT